MSLGKEKESILFSTRSKIRDDQDAPTFLRSSMFQRATRRNDGRAEASLGAAHPAQILDRRPSVRESGQCERPKPWSARKISTGLSENARDPVSRCLGKTSLPPAFPAQAAIYYRCKAGPANSPGPLGVDTGHPRREETFTSARNPARTTRSAYVNAASSQPPRPAGASFACVAPAVAGCVVGQVNRGESDT